MTMHPPNLAFIEPPRDPGLHTCAVFRRKDGSMFYGATWEGRPPFVGRSSPKTVAYLVCIRMKPAALEAQALASAAGKVMETFA